MVRAIAQERSQDCDRYQVVVFEDDPPASRYLMAIDERGNFRPPSFATTRPWKSGGTAACVLIGLECGEAEILGPAGELHCDLSTNSAQTLRELLKGDTHQRPAASAD